jgi:hypothetical protein
VTPRFVGGHVDACLWGSCLLYLSYYLSLSLLKSYRIDAPLCPHHLDRNYFDQVPAMKTAADSKRVLITVPLEVRKRLEERAKYHGGTIGAEAVRSVRERMEREKGRTAAAPE